MHWLLPKHDPHEDPTCAQCGHRCSDHPGGDRCGAPRSGGRVCRCPGYKDYLEAWGTPAIVCTPGVCGGDARIAGTRIPVWTLHALWRAGLIDDQILAAYPSLSSRQLRNAREYIEQHFNELEERALREERDK